MHPLRRKRDLPRADLCGESAPPLPLRRCRGAGLHRRDCWRLLHSSERGFRKKVYRSIEDLQVDLDEWMRHYNEARTHQGRWCFGKTPMQTFLDSRTLAREKQNISEAP
jgi:hypothetical protein